MFYIYTLTDPRDGAVFYVGKGKGNRLANHESEARSGKHSRKCQRIRDIWESGTQVQKQIVKRFAKEDDAFDAEIALIAAIGLDNLTNVLPGGQGKAQPKKGFGVTDLRKSLGFVRRIVAFLNAGGTLSYRSEDLTPVYRTVIESARAAVGTARFVEIVGADLA